MGAKERGIAGRQLLADKYLDSYQIIPKDIKQKNIRKRNIEKQSEHVI